MDSLLSRATTVTIYHATRILFRNELMELWKIVYYEFLHQFISVLSAFCSYKLNCTPACIYRALLFNCLLLLSLQELILLPYYYSLQFIDLSKLLELSCGQIVKGNDPILPSFSAFLVLMHFLYFWSNFLRRLVCTACGLIDFLELQVPLEMIWHFILDHFLYF
jgi:hypothetical protein